jgi:hypothetical protein
MPSFVNIPVAAAHRQSISYKKLPTLEPTGESEAVR